MESARPQGMHTIMEPIDDSDDEAATIPDETHGPQPSAEPYVKMGKYDFPPSIAEVQIMLLDIQALLKPHYTCGKYKDNKLRRWTEEKLQGMQSLSCHYIKICTVQRSQRPLNMGSSIHASGNWNGKGTCSGEVSSQVDARLYS